MTVYPLGAAEREMEAQEAIVAVLVAQIETGYPPYLVHIEDAPPRTGVVGQSHLRARGTNDLLRPGGDNDGIDRIRVECP
jgi:hypothetical protein